VNNVTVRDSVVVDQGDIFFWFNDFGRNVNTINYLKVKKGGVLAISRNSLVKRRENWKI